MDGAVRFGRRCGLIVSPDVALRRKCCDSLEGAGFLVEVAESGFDAVVAARDVRPNFIFVDMTLPDVPAGDAVAWLRANPLLHAVPIVVLAATSDDEFEIAALFPDAILRKPVSSEMIVRTIVDVFLSGQDLIHSRSHKPGIIAG